MSLSICFKKLNNQELDIDGYFFIWHFFGWIWPIWEKKALIYLCFVWPANHLQFLSNITNIMTMILMFVMMMMMMMTKPDRETEEKTSLSDSLLFSPLGSIWCWESFCFITFSSVFFVLKKVLLFYHFLSINWSEKCIFFNIQKHSVLREFYHFSLDK